jgi:2-polyprenyl-3-methyl-5-hydroxy-6-metoxy-1,4-benzoquinol methylase
MPAQASCPGAGPRVCDLCASSDSETLSATDRDGEPLETVICRTCGLVSHARVPTEEELADFYARQYREQYHGEHTPSARRLVRAWENAGRILRQLSPLLEPGARVLEVGAGIGCTVKRFALAGFDARGVEPHEGFRQFSRTRLHARVDPGTVRDLPTDGSIDMILLVHVIEHFGSPRDALRRMHGMLRPHGLLHVECPNLGAPFTVRHRLFHEAHTFNFTLSSLSMLARSCGFERLHFFTPGSDSNLQVVFRKVEPRPVVIDPGNRAETLAAIERATPLRHYLRTPYIASRARQLLTYLDEHLTAQRRAREILRICRATPEPVAATRAAA